MPPKPIPPDKVGLPKFAVPVETAAPVEPHGAPTVFALTSHRRAREALEFGLGIPDLGFNIFVLGDNRSGRMTATVDFLNAYVRRQPPSPDWIYLNNFKIRERPRPYRLPPGTGRRFCQRMSELLPVVEETLKKTFGAPKYAQQLNQTALSFRAALAEDFEALQKLALSHGVELRRTEQGVLLLVRDEQGQPRDYDSLDEQQRARLDAAWRELQPELQKFSYKAASTESQVGEALRQVRHAAVERVVEPLMTAVIADYSQHPGLARWLTEMREDLIDQVARVAMESDGEPARRTGLAERYAINLLVDRTGDQHPSVVLEPNPTYENLFGTIQYRSNQGVMETSFTMIRAGALHRANGGVLVLRAEALARLPQVWEFLKGALRDREIRIEELHRSGSLPMAGAPRPKPIPLDLKVVIVGAPRWYYAFFSVDPDFQSYFKVKADIDPDMEATPENIATYAAIIRAASRALGGLPSDDSAVGFLLGQASRWAEHRDKLSARFEQIEDVVSEAAANVRARKGEVVTADDIRAALDDRRRRNARVEDRSQELIRAGTVMIDVSGTRVGRVNALTVRDLGDHNYGMPTRVTARTFAGEHGVINIERMTDMGGPIQQKGVFVLSGFLNGLFARRFPLSFSASITFEQNYGGVEGDSASLAELLAILSSLADVPLRQDIAVTGSVNQQGDTQAIGGANHKIEGFFRTCRSAGLTGRHGVLIPAANEQNISVRPDVAEAVAAGQFHIWSAATVEEAIELFTGLPAGTFGPDDAIDPATVYGRVMSKLERFDRALTKRMGRRR